MKKWVFSLMVAALFIATMATSYADNGDWHGEIRSRIAEAQQRIERGVDRGSLTRQEAKSLQGELGVILGKIDRMKQDGRFDLGEREKINRDLDRLDNAITREKRNDEVATGHSEGGDWYGGIRSRVAEAQQRIERGIERGSLTRREARRLREQLNSILEKIDRMKRDAEKINRDIDLLDKDIAREKRDDERRHH